MPPQVVNGYTVQVVSPVNGIHTRDRRPDITVLGTGPGATIDIQVEWRTTRATQSTPPLGPWAPTATYTTEFLDAGSGTPQAVEAPTDLTYTTWWYRARVGDKDANIWGEWTGQFWLDVYPILGSTSEYIDINIGVETPTHLDSTVSYLEMNIGIEPTEMLDTIQYAEMNVGVSENLKLAAEYSTLNVFPPTGEYLAAHYSALNVVTDETPVPHIWWIRPEQGKEGYVFNIYGHGFGQFQNEFDGIVKLGNLTCAITRWEVMPRSALTDADLKIMHGMGLDPDEITVEHGWIVAIVPTGAVSSMVTVVLEDD